MKEMLAELEETTREDILFSRIFQLNEEGPSGRKGRVNF